MITMRNMKLQILLKGLRIYDLEDNKNNKDLKWVAKEMLFVYMAIPFPECFLCLACLRGWRRNCAFFHNEISLILFIQHMLIKLTRRRLKTL